MSYKKICKITFLEMLKTVDEEEYNNVTGFTLNIQINPSLLIKKLFFKEEFCILIGFY